jgi:hypothetical protein
MSTTDEFGNSLRDMSTSASEDWDDEETKFFVRNNVTSVTCDCPTDHSLDELRQEFADYDFEHDYDIWDLPSVKPSMLEVVAPLLGVGAILAFYLAMWLH